MAATMTHASNDEVKVDSLGRQYCGLCATESKRRSHERLKDSVEFKQARREAQARYRAKKKGMA